MAYQSPKHYEANEYFQYDVQHRAASEYGPNESPLEEDSNTNGDFSEYDEGDGLNSESSDEEGSSSLRESLPDPEMSTQAMEAAAYPVESGTAQMELRDSVPYMNIGGSDGYINYEEQVNASCRNLCESEDLHIGMRFNTKEDLKRHVNMFHCRKHCDYVVHESKLRLWSAYCLKKKDQGCKWRL